LKYCPDSALFNENQKIRTEEEQGQSKKTDKKKN
jgi:hypothetical protein